jgi:hypothetical protein
VFCRLDITQNKDWLVVVYAAGPPVPMNRPHLLRALFEHLSLPDLPSDCLDSRKTRD